MSLQLVVVVAFFVLRRTMPAFQIPWESNGYFWLRNHQHFFFPYPTQLVFFGLSADTGMGLAPTHHGRHRGDGPQQAAHVTLGSQQQPQPRDPPKAGFLFMADSPRPGKSRKKRFGSQKGQGINSPVFFIPSFLSLEFWNGANLFCFNQWNWTDSWSAGIVFRWGGVFALRGTWGASKVPLEAFCFLNGTSKMLLRSNSFKQRNIKETSKLWFPLISKIFYKEIHVFFWPMAYRSTVCQQIRARQIHLKSW